MRVSIVIPVYNTRPYLRECIDSALNQTHGDTEVIAVDDGSTDGSLDLLKEYGGSIRVVPVPHGGISAALNAGIRAMTGEWFKGLGSDDILHTDAVERLLAAACGPHANGAPPERLVPYGDAETIAGDGSPLGRPYPSPSNPLTTVQQGAMMLDSPYGLSSVSLIHRSAFDDIGTFDARYHIAEDVELNLRLAIRGRYRMLHVPSTIYRYRRRRGQTTAGRLAVARDLRRVSRDCWAGMDPRTREAYAAEYKRLLRAKLFLYGVWARANRAWRPDVHSSSSGGGRAAGPAIGRDCLPRLAYNAAKVRSVQPCVRGIGDLLDYDLLGPRRHAGLGPTAGCASSSSCSTCQGRGTGGTGGTSGGAADMGERGTPRRKAMPGHGDVHAACAVRDAKHGERDGVRHSRGERPRRPRPCARTARRSLGSRLHPCLHALPGPHLRLRGLSHTRSFLARLHAAGLAGALRTGHFPPCPAAFASLDSPLHVPTRLPRPRDL